MGKVIDVSIFSEKDDYVPREAILIGRKLPQVKSKSQEKKFRRKEHFGILKSRNNLFLSNLPLANVNVKGKFQSFKH
jgi:hypothetical protein